ncbi:MAG: asparagine synthase (glutamine-hydrolyzing) [Chitinophagaceae bacterium]|nr:asparagine synthase (glutamine-hydrolyzing) [Chitinophagaceae bacterium]
MCGIAGIIQTHSKQYSGEHLQKMTDALAHRGPDGEGHWLNDDETCMLGHRRLSIIDLSGAGDQPMHYLGRYVIVHNGEIYNYIELRKGLEQKGYTFHSQTDTEVIVAAYDYWNEDCLQHFDGMFAFAIWDEKEKTVFAARDRFGEKPFFYYYDNNRFLFASEMKALWAAGIEKTPNQKMLFNFITIGYTDNPERPEETFYDGIYKLPAASFLKFSFIYFSYSIQQYWDIDLNNQQNKITDKEAIEKFADLLNTSVTRRLRSDVAVGTSLSGGLDSSSVVSQLLTIQHSLLTAFTASFPNFEKDETGYAKQVAKQFNLQHFTTAVSGNELMDDWEKLCYHQEEPFGSASIYAQYKVFELAKQQNIKVLLDGQGADEILAGYHKYYKWYWQELFRKRKLYKSKELSAAKQSGVAETFDYKNMIAAYFPVFASVVLERQYLLKAIKQEDLTKDFVRQQSREAYYTPPEHFDLNGQLYFNTRTHGLEELLRYADRNSMAHGREDRLPFLSYELVEFVFSLPSHFKIRDGWTKWLLRQSMGKSLPAEIVWRRDKVGFEPPQKQWMELAAVKDAIHEAKKKLVSENILKAEVLNKPSVPLAAHEADNYDWRYLSAAVIFK